MKIKYLLISCLFLMIITLVGCQPTGNSQRIVTTMFVQYDLTKQIVKDRYPIILLAKAGTDSHDYEPTSRDVIEIRNAALFIFTSEQFDALWIKNVSSTHKVSLENLSSLTEKTTYEEHNHEHETHFWTDPVLVMEIILNLTNVLSGIYPESTDFFNLNASEYIKTILTTDEKIQSQKTDRTIFFASHNSMDGFASHYQLNLVSLSNSFKPDAEVTSKQLTLLIDAIIVSESKFIFLPEQANQRTVDMIVREVNLKTKTNLTILELHGYHNISFQDLQNGTSYADLLLRNYTNLKEAGVINDQN